MAEWTKSKKKSQKLALLGLLTASVDGVSPLEARHVLGVERLAARILELKEDGYPIRAETKTDVNWKRYTRYFLIRTSAETENSFVASRLPIQAHLRLVS
jgi:hypothetical protein